MQKNKERDAFQKTVAVKETAPDGQTAKGIVMVPSTVDLHGDYVTENTIQQFAEQFGNFVNVGEGSGGVMHATWPGDHLSLEANTVTNEETTVGGETVPAGAWLQTWSVNDSELYSLISDSVLEGYSIGAVNVKWRGPMSQDELPDDVDVSDGYPDDKYVWELTDGLIREVSAVDIPAVPDAQILETKAGDETKRLADHLPNRDGFIEEAQERGHSEDDAERLWDYLYRAADMEGAGDPGTKEAGRLRAAGKAFLDAFTPGSDGEDRAVADKDTAKESRALSAADRERLMATHDAVEDALSSDMDFIGNRFTDNPALAFDVADHPTAASAVESESPAGDEKNNEQPSDESADTDTTDADAVLNTMDEDELQAKFDTLEEQNEQTNETLERVADALEEQAQDEKSDEPDEPTAEDLLDQLEQMDETQQQLAENQRQVTETLAAMADAAGESQQTRQATTGGNEASEKAQFFGLAGGD